MTIGVMLTVYKRPQNLRRQLEALRIQSVPFDNLVIWINGKEALGERDLPSLNTNETFVQCEGNWGVWPRFTFARHLPGDFIAVFDDDTIPGHRWLENCQRTMASTGNALLGANGVSFPNASRAGRQYFGWSKPDDQAVQVDIVGHAWYFPRELLEGLAAFRIPAGISTCGEDYTLSAAAQLLGWKTYCPPHPPNKEEFWGSVDAMLGADDQALYKDPAQEQLKEDFHQELVRDGWKPEALCR